MARTRRAGHRTRHGEPAVELREAVDAFVLGDRLAENLPDVAGDALVAGYDSPALRELAGLRGGDSEELRKLFRKALQELNEPLPAPSEAGLSLARRIASEIVKGTIRPYEGARQIWWKIYVRFPDLEELVVFVGCASEWEDDRRHREDYERDIVEESRKLLSRAAPGTTP